MTTPTKAPAKRPKRPTADWEGAKERFPSVNQFTEAHWVALFDAQPDVLYRLIGDICKAVVATEAEVRRTGRRPAPSLSLRDVERILSPRYSQEPFRIALAELMLERGISQRSFAAKVPVHHHTIRRLLDGEIPPSKAMMESLARVGRVAPHYFREWRAQELSDLLLAHFERHPNQSIGWIRQLRALDLPETTGSTTPTRSKP